MFSPLQICVSLKCELASTPIGVITFPYNYGLFRAHRHHLELNGNELGVDRGNPDNDIESAAAENLK